MSYLTVFLRDFFLWNAEIYWDKLGIRSYLHEIENAAAELIPTY